jgi:hypothetical protein
VPKPLAVSRSRTYPVPIDEAFARTLALPLEQLCSRRYGPLPPIKGTTQEGAWSTAGQVRTIHSADGGTMREHLLAVEPPHQFRYEITEITGPMKPIAGRVDGAWTFAPAGTGTRITWSWTIHPASSASVVVLPVLGRLWRGYARQVLERLEELLLS